MTSSAAPAQAASPVRDAPDARRWLAAAGCALAGAAVFQFYGNANHGYIDTSSLFWWWGFQWWNPESETQHGWLVLGIAAWLLWRNVRCTRSQESRAESLERILAVGAKPETGYRKPERVGDRTTRRGDASASAVNPVSAIRNPQLPALAAMVGALGLHTLGFAGQQARLSILALLLFTWGVLRLGGGKRWGAAAAFPLAFLVFAIPLNVLDSVGFWLRLWVIKASSGIAHLGGIAVVQSGTQLMAPDGRYNYDVAAACSGVRSLMALAALSLLIGYLNFQSWWRRGVLLVVCFPLVYVGNVARIVAIVFAAQVGGSKWGDRAHEFMGYGVFAIVLGGVFAVAALLRRLGPADGPESAKSDGRPGKPAEGTIADGLAAGGSDTAVSGVTALPESAPSGRRQSAWVVGIPTAVVVVCAAVTAVWLHRMAVMPSRGQVGIALASDGRNPVELPALLSRDWVGWPAAVSTIEREVLPPDTGYSRMNYVPSRGSRAVFLSIVLSGRDRTSIHRPELCLVGQGWTIVGSTGHTFTYPSHPEITIPATVLHVQRPVATPRGATVVPQLVVYWFVGGDTVVATHWQRLLHDAWNRVVHARADRWAYVLMQTDATDGDAAAIGRLQEVLDGTLPVFEPVGLQVTAAEVAKAK